MAIKSITCNNNNDDGLPNPTPRHLTPRYLPNSLTEKRLSGQGESKLTFPRIVPGLNIEYDFVEINQLSKVRVRETEKILMQVHVQEKGTQSIRKF